MSVETIIPATNNDSHIKIPGYDGPANGCTSKSKVERDTKTESNVETLVKNIQVHRSYKGPISIKEVCIDGAYIVLENSGKRGDINISDWQIVRKVDNHNEITYTLPQNTILMGNTTLTIWSKNETESKKELNDLIADIDWNSGDNIITRLVNNKKSERALHNQKTSSIIKS